MVAAKSLAPVELAYLPTAIQLPADPHDTEKIFALGEGVPFTLKPTLIAFQLACVGVDCQVPATCATAKAC